MVQKLKGAASNGPPLTFIVPTTVETSGIETARRALVKCPDSEAIVVVDGYGAESVGEEKGITVVRLPALGGSYNARNVGATLAKAEVLCFLDDQVRIDTLPAQLPKTEIVGPTVSFKDPPTDRFSLWYQHNAFTTHIYLSRDRFIPTLAILIPRWAFNELSGFDGSLVSAGDVEFGRRAAKRLNLRIAADFHVSTDARTKHQIRLKIQRQVYGRVQYWAQSNGLLYAKSRAAAAAIANVALLRGQPADPHWSRSAAWGYRRANARVCLWKSQAYLVGAASTLDGLIVRARGANRTEISDRHERGADP